MDAASVSYTMENQFNLMVSVIIPALSDRWSKSDCLGVLFGRVA
jgi:hypothetical protein